MPTAPNTGLNPCPLTKAGRIQQPHGVDGEVRVVGDEIALDHLLQRGYWFVGFEADSVLHVRVEAARAVTSAKGKAIIARLWCAASRTEASRLRGAGIYVPAEEMPETDSDENPVAGFVVVDDSGKNIGTVTDFRKMPAQDLIVVLTPAGKEVLIPDTPAIVKDVNAVDGIMTVKVIEGLFEI